MTWEQLTQEQRDVYLVFERDLRALAGETQRLFSKFSALKSRKTAIWNVLQQISKDNGLLWNTLLLYYGTLGSYRIIILV